MDSLRKIRTHLGDLWWFTTLLFIAQRLADLVNAVVGLWLVPKYVPMAELGAVLPLANVGAMLGMPLGLFSIPLLKFLTQYIQEGAFGKAKRLVLDVLILAAGLLLVLLLFSPPIVATVFGRLRVANGMLSVLIVTTGVVAALCPIFQIILQAQKRFQIITILSVVLAATRFATMAVCLPIRGLSGYFVGQIVPMLVVVGVTFLTIRKELWLHVRCEPYLRESWRQMLKYSVAPAVYMLFANFAGTVMSIVVRRCLPDVESAGYYMITRFAEIAMALGLTCATVLFPLATEETKSDERRSKLLFQSMAFPVVWGIVFTMVCTPLVWLLFKRIVGWQMYLPFIPHLIALGILYSICGAVHCYYAYQCAKGSFQFIPLFTSLMAIQGVFLYCFTGYTFFAPWLPTAWLKALTAFNPCRLSVVIGITSFFYAIMFIYALADLFRKHTGRAASRRPNRSNPPVVQG